MRKFIFILFSISLLFSCEKNVIGDFGNTLPENTQDETVSINKKGVAFPNRAKDWSYRTSDLKANWMYSWGNTLADEIPENVEFVPMFWGKGSITEENLTRVQQLIDEGKVKYVLGFNEPDNGNQANMTVDEAIALWPKLESLGVPLISPATVGVDNTWMKKFMQKADEQGLRVDYVAMHSYGGASALNFINKLKQAHELYKRPIWVTEFAVADWNATTPEDNKYSEAQVIEFMQDVTSAMNNLDWVARYAWFDGRNAPLASSSLFDDEFNITTLGQVYASINPNENIGPGQETQYTPPVDESEIIVNGGFETGDITPWGGFKNGINSSEPHTGNYCGKIENNDGSLLQIVAVEAGKTYTLKFWSKWSENISNSFAPMLRNNDGNALLYKLDPLPMTDTWEETTFEFTVPDGVTQLKIVFYKGQATPTFPSFYLDDVSLKE